VIATELTRAWGLRHPVIAAPMAGVSGGELAGAVSAAGGLGFIGVGADEPAWIAAEAARARARAPRFGIGFIAHILERRDELLEAALEQEPFVVSISFADPAPWVERIHAAGARAVTQVQDGAGVRMALAAGVDAIVAQGTDAGGHTGHVGTLPLLQLAVGLAEPSHTPVIAAGGIATGLGLAAVLACGAQAGWIGTRFAATHEGLGSAAAKTRIVAAGEDETVLTRAFDVAEGRPWPERFPGRALRNAFTDRWHGHEEELAAARDSAGAQIAAARGGDDYDTAYVYAGQAAGLIDDVASAGELVGRLAAGAEQALERASRLRG
jgi:nitronate monooxygenase